MLAREHAYTINLSPRKLKRKLDETIDMCESKKKKIEDSSEEEPPTQKKSRISDRHCGKLEKK